VVGVVSSVRKAHTGPVLRRLGGLESRWLLARCVGEQQPPEAGDEDDAALIS